MKIITVVGSLGTVGALFTTIILATKDMRKKVRVSMYRHYARIQINGVIKHNLEATFVNVRPLPIHVKRVTVAGRMIFRNCLEQNIKEYEIDELLTLKMGDFLTAKAHMDEIESLFRSLGCNTRLLRFYIQIEDVEGKRFKKRIEFKGKSYEKRIKRKKFRLFTKTCA